MRDRPLRAVGALLLLVLGVAPAITACSTMPQALHMATTGTLASLDPVATVDATSRGIMAELYPLLLQRDPRTGELALGLADSAAFTSPTEYTVTIPANLRFANGDPLTSSDVVFSIQRMLELGPQSGPAAQLGGLLSVSATDPQTVVFELSTPDDAAFPSALATSAGAIVDEEVFSADAATSFDVILAGQPFAGPYRLGEDSTESAMTFLVDPAYAGTAPVTSPIELELGVDPSDAAQRLDTGGLDAVWGAVPETDVQTLNAAAAARAVTHPSATLTSLVFDLATMPFGTATDTPNADKATAVRTALADLVDRASLARAAPGLWQGWASYLPGTLGGDPKFVEDRTGDGSGGPSVDAAAEVLKKAGIETPVPLTITIAATKDQTDPDPLSAALAAQLAGNGLFTVQLSLYQGDFSRSVLAQNHFPAFVHSFSPLGLDPDAYLVPLYGADSVLANNADSPAVAQDLAKEAALTDPAKRLEALGAVQEALARRLTSIPLLQRLDVAWLGPRVTGGAISSRGHLEFESLLLT